MAVSTSPVPPANDVQEMYATFMTQLSKVTELQGQTAVTLERVNGSLNAHDNRIKALEDARRDEAKEAPAAVRGWLGLIIAAGAGCLVPVMLGVGSGLVALVLHLTGL